MKKVIGRFPSRACGMTNCRPPARKVPDARMDEQMMVAAAKFLKACRVIRSRNDGKLCARLKCWKKSTKLLVDPKQFHIKDQSRVRRNRATRSGNSITQLRRNSQLSLAANFHSRNSFIPAFNYLTCP